MRKVFYILGILEDADIEWMAQRGRQITVESGTTLICQGEPIGDLFILLDGQLTVLVRVGEVREVARLEPGEVIGEISFVDRRLPTASVIAQKNSRLLSLSRTELEDKIARDAGFAGRFYRAVATFLADRLALTTSRFGYGDASQDSTQDQDPSELDDSRMDEISLAAVRFDKLLRYLSQEQHGGSFAAVR